MIGSSATLDNKTKRQGNSRAMAGMLFGASSVGRQNSRNRPMNWYPQTGISNVICFIARLFDAAASELSLIVSGLWTNGPFSLCLSHGLIRAPIIESRVFSSKAVPDSCTANAADDDRRCHCAHCAGNEIDSLGSVHSN
jgi:hypothetical protein